MPHQPYFVVVLAHSLHGRLRRIHVPHKAVYAAFVFAVLGCLFVFGFLSSYLRMTMKVAHYNTLRQEVNSLRAKYQELQSITNQKNEQLATLEAFAGELACERITPVELSEIKALHYAMLACREQNDLSGYYSRNQAIHAKINDAARNSALRQTYIAVNRRLQALRFRSNFQTVKWDSAIRDHEAMIEALEARDGKRMAAILRGHLLSKRDAVLAERTMTTLRPRSEGGTLDDPPPG